MSTTRKARNVAEEPLQVEVTVLFRRAGYGRGWLGFYPRYRAEVRNWRVPKGVVLDLPEYYRSMGNIRAGLLMDRRFDGIVTMTAWTEAGAHRKARKFVAQDIKERTPQTYTISDSEGHTGAPRRASGFLSGVREGAQR